MLHDESHTCQVSGFLGESPNFAPISPRGGGEAKSPEI